MQDLKLLDCSLRDGGYINDWKWGFDNARSIIRLLVKAGVDVVEVGFLRNVEKYDKECTVCNYIEELNHLLPENKGKTMFSGMAMRSNYDINKLSDYCGSGIEMIRITAHDYDIQEGLEFARIIKSKGYKVSINPINIMGYSDEQILHILEQVNNIQPYQFSIVDTFGSMKRRDLDRIVSLVDNNLSRNIRVALHLHENMSLSTSLAQQYIDKHLNRPVSVDGSLMGIGRIPGNLPIELIADYLNDYLGKNYDIDYMMDAIQDYIAPMKGETEWGYTPTYFLSARHNLHRNYAEYYLKKGDLTNRDIDAILSGFDRKKTTVFDASYADELYQRYKNCNIDDSVAVSNLQKIIQGKNVLIIAPGKSLSENLDEIKQYIATVKPVVISINFVPEKIQVDYAFFSNSKRFNQINDNKYPIIATSNIKDIEPKILIDYNRLVHSFDKGNNSLIMLLSLLKILKVSNVTIAGADGYKENGQNYYKSTMKSATEHFGDYNLKVAMAIKKVGIKIEYLTPSEYNIKW